MSNINYFIKIDEERKAVYITDENDELQEIDLINKNKSNNLIWIECYNLYPKDLSFHEILKLFKKDYTHWTDEIKGLYDKNNYDYFDAKKYFTNRGMIMAFFKKYSNKKLEELKIPDIGFLENSWINKTPCGGLTYLKEEEGDEKYKPFEDTFGYDFKSFYPNILGNSDLDLKFPIREGKEKVFKFEELKELYKKKKIPFGYYKIKITCKHPDFCKFFCFSKDDIYNTISLNFCFRYHFLFKIEFHSDEINAYVYDDKDLIKSSEIFGKWFKVLNDMRKRLPKNPILKYMTSSLWGQITKYNRFFITEKQLLERDDITRDLSDDKPYLLKKFNNENSIEIFDKKNCYKNGGLARIKSFLTAYSRDYMARTLITNKLHNNIIRICVDGVILNKPHEFNEKYKPLPEEKSSGTLFFINLNDYYKKCDKCQRFYHFKNKCCFN